jgi:DNA-binding NtrC family response regulator
LLADALLRAVADRPRKRIPGIAPAALEALVAYHWPGKVRELQNELARAVALALDGDVPRPAHFSTCVTGAQPVAHAAAVGTPARPPTSDRRGRPSAGRAVMSRPGLQRMMKRLGLRASR